MHWIFTRVRLALRIGVSAAKFQVSPGCQSVEPVIMPIAVTAKFCISYFFIYTILIYCICILVYLYKQKDPTGLKKNMFIWMCLVLCFFVLRTSMAFSLAGPAGPAHF